MTEEEIYFALAAAEKEATQEITEIVGRLRAEGKATPEQVDAAVEKLKKPRARQEITHTAATQVAAAGLREPTKSARQQAREDRKNRQEASAKEQMDKKQQQRDRNRRLQQERIAEAKLRKEERGKGRERGK